QVCPRWRYTTLFRSAPLYPVSAVVAPHIVGVATTTEYSWRCCCAWFRPSRDGAAPVRRSLSYAHHEAQRACRHVKESRYARDPLDRKSTRLNSSHVN